MGILFGLVFLLVVLGAAGASIYLPIRAMTKWEGLWKWAAALPLIFSIYSLVTIIANPRNLFPIEIVFNALIALGILGLVFVIRDVLEKK